jgi:hypothetical protein
MLSRHSKKVLFQNVFSSFFKTCFFLSKLKDSLFAQSFSVT